MATKGSVFTLAGLLVAAAVYDVWRRWRDGESPLIALAAAPSGSAVAGLCRRSPPSACSSPTRS